MGQAYMSNPTDKELDQGYRVCECGDGVHLLQSGFEIDLNMCSLCQCEVADTGEFFKFKNGIEALSK